MLGPYRTRKDGQIKYVGNKIFPPMLSISNTVSSMADLENRVSALHDHGMWPAISRINNQINTSVTEFFNAIGALFVPLPLTTRMISSPGAVYGKEAIDYTTDTCPITVNWFDLPRPAFLAESSQIYLELALLQKGIDHVFANYNSFRKEKADATHLSEFHHIEYEGHVDQSANARNIMALLKKIVTDLLKNNEPDLRVCLYSRKLEELDALSRIDMPTITFKTALNLLYKDTKNKRYEKFTLQHFGAWEEVRLTEIIGGSVCISEMPLLEVPFYHAMKYESEPKVADNADIIWSGYREIAGSGHRVRSVSELEEKAKLFNLPRDDYQPYLQSRQFLNYKQTSGFGLGWERLLQGLLEMPFIYSAALFPRIHSTLRP